jgi:CRP-like cAMP-binding protein
VLALESTCVMAITPDPRENLLLAALPDSVLKRWLPQLEPVYLPLGKVIFRPHSILNHVYFPTTSMVALLYVTEDGGSTEVAIVGLEGLVGISVIYGAESSTRSAIVQSAGDAFRIKTQAITDEFERNGPVMHLLMRYAQALIAQMAQTAVCNRHHSLDQQLCCWLLRSLDRLQGIDLVMTQELIASMLGVRREGVTEGALKLQKAKLIRYARGHITVLDRPGLEKRTCECYEVVKNEYDRLLSMPPAVSLLPKKATGRAATQQPLRV